MARFNFRQARPKNAAAPSVSELNTTMAPKSTATGSGRTPRMSQGAGSTQWHPPSSMGPVPGQSPFHLGVKPPVPGAQQGDWSQQTAGSAAGMPAVQQLPKDVFASGNAGLADLAGTPMPEPEENNTLIDPLTGLPAQNADIDALYGDLLQQHDELWGGREKLVDRYWAGQERGAGHAAAKMGSYGAAALAGQRQGFANVMGMLDQQRQEWEDQRAKLQAAKTDALLGQTQEGIDRAYGEHVASREQANAKELLALQAQLGSGEKIPGPEAPAAGTLGEQGITEIPNGADAGGNAYGVDLDGDGQTDYQVAASTLEYYNAFEKYFSGAGYDYNSPEVQAGMLKGIAEYAKAHGGEIPSPEDLWKWLYENGVLSDELFLSGAAQAGIAGLPASNASASRDLARNPILG